MVEGIRLALVVFRVAVGPIAALSIPAERLGPRIPLDIVHYEQIELAIVVVIEPAAGDGPTVVPDAGFRSDVFEGSVAAIAEQETAPHAGNKQIGVSVVIEVGRRHSGCEAIGLNTGSFGDVFKSAVAAIPVEPVPVAGACFFKRRLARAVGEIDIGVAVIVEVEYRHAANHGFNLVLLRGGGVAQHKVYAGCNGALFKWIGVRRG